MSASKPSPFLLLPIELRQSVYDLLIEDSILAYPQWGSIYQSWPVAPAKDNLAIEVKSNNIFFKSFRLESGLIYANRQICAEFTDHIYQQIRHLRITGDFLLGVGSTQEVLDALARRPWISANVRTVRLVVLFGYGQSQHHNFLPDVDAGRQFPWVRRHIESARKSLELVPPFLNNTHWPRVTGQPHSEDTGLPFRPDEGPTNTIPDLMRLLNAFPFLESLDIEIDEKSAFMLWPDPMNLLQSLESLDAKSIDINIVVKGLARAVFLAIMVQRGFDEQRAIAMERDGNNPVFDFLASARGVRGAGLIPGKLFNWFPQVEEKSVGVSTTET